MDAQKHLFDNKKMAALLIPLAIDQLLNSFMGTVDTLVVSNLGSAAISAVTLVDSSQIMQFALKPGGGAAIQLVPVTDQEIKEYKKYKGQVL